MRDGPFRSGRYRWLFAARTVSALGNGLAPVALAFAVLDLTGSATDLGVVVASRSAASVVLMLGGGVLADRLPRSAVLVGSSSVAAAAQMTVAALVLTGTATVPILCLLSALNGAAAAATFPAAAALTPQTVPSLHLRSANALLRLGMNATQAASAAAGGALIAVAGPGWGIAVDAASFAVAACMFARLPRMGRPEATGTRFFGDLAAGWKEFVSRPWTWIVVLQFTFVNAAYVGATAVLGPPVADRTIGRAAWGAALAAGGAGLLVGAVSALRFRPRHPLRWGTVCVLGLALPPAVLAAAPGLPLLAAAFFVSGVCAEQFGVAWDVSLQQHVPPERLSRVYSYDALGSLLAIPAGELAAGPAAHALGLRTALLAAVGVVVVPTCLALTSRTVRDLRRESAETEPA